MIIIKKQKASLHSETILLKEKLNVFVGLQSSTLTRSYLFITEKGH